MKVRITLTRSLVGALALATLAACSSGGGDASVSAGAASGGGAGYVAQSRALLAKATEGAVTGPSFGTVAADKLVAWRPQDMPTPSALPTGKKTKVDVVYAFPVGSPPYATHLIEKIAPKLGWDVKVFQAATPTQQGALAAMQQAILDKPAAIVVPVVPATWITPALEKARAQGIHTVGIHQDTTGGGGFDAYVPAAEGVQKALLAAWAVAQSNGKAKTLLVSAPGFSDANVPAAEKYLKDCSGCSTKSIQFNPDVFIDPTKTQSSLAATLAANPDVDYVMWPNGSAPLPGALNGISASRDRNAKLIVNTAGPGSVQMLKAGKLPVVVHHPEAMLALAAIDQVSRLVQGKAPLAQDALRLPVTYWTKQDASAPDYASITAAELKANDWLSPYEKAWDVSLKDTVLGVRN
ncbi:sugar ABC transporter substrate-binding protein [Streptomyces sp. NPDC005492]|uniref:sugar ABC transporter substrate-binding protein n=1 Tax=Streptomyces sp. NPDC005492 TaxID=3156883 RepID=UPI0033BF3B0A